MILLYAKTTASTLPILDQYNSLIYMYMYDFAVTNTSSINIIVYHGSTYTFKLIIFQKHTLATAYQSKVQGEYFQDDMI